MLNIAICDDDIEELKRIFNIVNDNFLNSNAEFKIEQFHSGRDMLENSCVTMFDLIFLDIDMPKISGIDVADKMKATNKDVEIIFISNRQDLMGKAIHYSPFRFIEKVNLNNDISEAIEAYINKISNEILLFELDIMNHQPIKIRVKDILYLESIGHKIKVNYIESYFDENNMNRMRQYSESEFRGNLYEFQERWTMFGFIRASKSYFVNVRYIKKIEREGIILDNNDVVAVSRKYYDNVREEYYKYVRKYSYGER